MVFVLIAKYFSFLIIFFCTELKCPGLGSVIYAEKSCNGVESKQGTNCDFTCNKGNYSLYPPSNDGQLTCMTSGQWNKEKPCCASMYRLMQLYLAHMQYIFINQ